jgi:hypothetical protein
MALTYVAIATVTVGSGGAANIDFQSIPATYTDLVLQTSVRVDSGTAATTLTFNGGGTGTFSSRWVRGNGSAASSSTETFLHAGYANYSGTTASTFQNGSIYIPNYAGSNQKSVSVDSVSEDNSSTAFAVLVAGLWNQTTAINRVTIAPVSGNYVQYSTATLYGIKNTV